MAPRTLKVLNTEEVHTVRSQEEIKCWIQENQQLRAENQALKEEAKALKDERNTLLVQVNNSLGDSVAGTAVLIESTIARLQLVMCEIAGDETFINCHSKAFSELAVIVYALRHEIDS